MFNTDHQIRLREFNALLRLPIYVDLFRDVLNRWTSDPICLSITCSKHKIHTDKFRRPRVYDSKQAMAIDICIMSICCLQCLMANIIFGFNDGQNLCQKVNLFLIWCELMDTYVDTGAFIICHLVEVAKTTHKNVIGVLGIVTLIA